jgi:hypothetical protein
VTDESGDLTVLYRFWRNFLEEPVEMRVWPWVEYVAELCCASQG